MVGVHVIPGVAARARGGLERGSDGVGCAVEGDLDVGLVLVEGFDGGLLEVNVHGGLEVSALVVGAGHVHVGAVAVEDELDAGGLVVAREVRPLDGEGVEVVVLGFIGDLGEVEVSAADCWLEDVALAAHEDGGDATRVCVGVAVGHADGGQLVVGGALREATDADFRLRGIDDELAFGDLVAGVACLVGGAEPEGVDSLGECHGRRVCGSDAAPTTDAAGAGELVEGGIEVLFDDGDRGSTYLVVVLAVAHVGGVPGDGDDGRDLVHGEAARREGVGLVSHHVGCGQGEVVVRVVGERDGVHPGVAGVDPGAPRADEAGGGEATGVEVVVADGHGCVAVGVVEARLVGLVERDRELGGGCVHADGAARFSFVARVIGDVNPHVLSGVFACERQGDGCAGDEVLVGGGHLDCGVIDLAVGGDGCCAQGGVTVPPGEGADAGVCGDGGEGAERGVLVEGNARAVGRSRGSEFNRQVGAGDRRVGVLGHEAVGALAVADVADLIGGCGGDEALEAAGDVELCHAGVDGGGFGADDGAGGRVERHEGVPQARRWGGVGDLRLDARGSLNEQAVTVGTVDGLARRVGRVHNDEVRDRRCLVVHVERVVAGADVACEVGHGDGDLVGAVLCARGFRVVHVEGAGGGGFAGLVAGVDGGDLGAVDGGGHGGDAAVVVGGEAVDCPAG